MIVKIQKPLNSSSALIYNENKSIFFLTPYTPELKKLLGDKLKIYVDVNEPKSGDPLVIQGMKIVEDQEWQMARGGGFIIRCSYCYLNTTHDRKHDVGEDGVYVPGSERYECRKCKTAIFKEKGERMGLQFELDTETLK